MTTCAIMSYKYGHLVAQAIESVLAQTKKFDRVLVVDDGIGDCGFVVEKYPVEYVYHKNFGVVDNFNDVLFNIATKGKIMFLGADNWLHPKTLELLTEKDFDITTYDCYIVGTEASKFIYPEMAQYEQDGYTVWRTNATPHGSSLYNIGLARKVGGYKASGNEKTEEDSMLFNKMLQNQGTSLFYKPQPLLYYRQHKGNYYDR